MNTTALSLLAACILLSSCSPQAEEQNVSTPEITTGNTVEKEAEWQGGYVGEQDADGNVMSKMHLSEDGSFHLVITLPSTKERKDFTGSWRGSKSGVTLEGKERSYELAAVSSVALRLEDKELGIVQTLTKGN